MKHPLVTLMKRELAHDPFVFLAPIIVSAVSAAILHSFLAFLVAIIRDPAIVANQDGFTFEDNIVSIAAVAAFTAIPAVIVLGSIGSGVALSMQHRIVRWRIAGATPAQCGVVVIGQLSIATLGGAVTGTFASLPVLPKLMGVITTMAGVPDAAIGASPESIGATIILTGVIGVLGALRPARTAGKILIGPTLREEEPQPHGRPIIRALVTIGLAYASFTTMRGVYALKPGTDISSGLGSAMNAGVLLVCTMAAGAPWFIPWVARLGHLIPSRLSPAWNIALGFIRANPRRTSGANLPFLVAAGIVGVFSASITTWQDSLNAAHSGESLNLSDTIAMMGPPAMIGLTGAACHILLSRRQRLADFTRIRIAGARTKTLVNTAVSEAIVGAGTVCVLATALSFAVSSMTAHALIADGMAARVTLNWPLHLGIIGAGFAATALIGVSAALAAGRGNPRGYLAG